MSIVNIVNIVNFKVIGDERGNLISLEENKNIPFDIKRVYYMYGLNKEPRGFHAHKNLQQVFIVMNGSCKLILDDGTKRDELVLNSPSQGLLIGNLIWHEMCDFSADCVIMVLASDYYDESDYIRNYEDFKKAVK